MNLLLIIVTLLPIIVRSNATSDLVDFEFDGSTNSELSKKIRKNDDNIDRMDWDDSDSSDAFEAKEQRIRDSLAQATKDSAYKKKFAQIMPIMRTLTKQQRLVLASLISAQTSARSSANVMNFAQVSWVLIFNNFF